MHVRYITDGKTKHSMYYVRRQVDRYVQMQVSVYVSDMYVDIYG